MDKLSDLAAHDMLEASLVVRCQRRLIATPEDVNAVDRGTLIATAVWITTDGVEFSDLLDALIHQNQLQEDLNDSKA